MAVKALSGGHSREAVQNSSMNTHGNVQQLPDGLIVSSAAIGHREGVHAASTKYRILIGAERGQQGLGLLEAAVHGERDAHRQSTEDLLVLRFLGVL